MRLKASRLGHYFAILSLPQFSSKGRPWVDIWAKRTFLFQSDIAAGLVLSTCFGTCSLQFETWSQGLSAVWRDLGDYGWGIRGYAGRCLCQKFLHSTADAEGRCSHPKPKRGAGASLWCCPALDRATIALDLDLEVMSWLQCARNDQVWQAFWGCMSIHL